MKTHTLLITSLFIAALSATNLFAADIHLPGPLKDGGVSALRAIDVRGSAENEAFPTGQITMEDLSTILWAASGRNRDGAKWTVPTGKWRPPYTRIYVTLESGSYRYEWDGHRLIQVSDVDARAHIPQQQFAQQAPAALYFVGDGEALSAFDDIPAWQEEFPLVLAGAMSQNVYIASEAVGVGARVVYSVKRDAMTEYFHLSTHDRPFFAMFLGKR